MIIKRSLFFFLPIARVQEQMEDASYQQNIYVTKNQTPCMNYFVTILYITHVSCN